MEKEEEEEEKEKERRRKGTHKTMLIYRLHNLYVENPMISHIYTHRHTYTGYTSIYKNKLYYHKLTMCNPKGNQLNNSILQ